MTLEPESWCKLQGDWEVDDVLGVLTLFSLLHFIALIYTFSSVRPTASSHRQLTLHNGSLFPMNHEKTPFMGHIYVIDEHWYT